MERAQKATIIISALVFIGGASWLIYYYGKRNKKK